MGSFQRRSSWRLRLLYELLYTSFASRDMSEADLMELLETARRKNARLDITGMLLFDQQEFMQILEGSRSDVLALYEEIRNDDRHQSVCTVHEGPIAERAFDGWSMAFRLLSKKKIGSGRLSRSIRTVRTCR